MRNDTRRPLPIHLIVGVVYNLGHARLQAGASFYDTAKVGVTLIPGLLFHPVDKGDSVKRDLHPISGGSGSISDKAKSKQGIG